MQFIKEHLRENCCHSLHDNNFEACEESSAKHFFKKKQKDNTKHVLDIYFASEVEDCSIFNGRCASLKPLALELNTPLPSSAACERYLALEGKFYGPKECACPMNISKHLYLQNATNLLLELAPF